jgi:hypothetical protein
MGRTPTAAYLTPADQSRDGSDKTTQRGKYTRFWQWCTVYITSVTFYLSLTSLFHGVNRASVQSWHVDVKVSQTKNATLQLIALRSDHATPTWLTRSHCGSITRPRPDPLNILLRERSIVRAWVGKRGRGKLETKLVVELELAQSVIKCHHRVGWWINVDDGINTQASN